MKPPLNRAALAALTIGYPPCGDPENSRALLEQLRFLYDVGRRDLPRGRLFEGHVDALQIIDRIGTTRQAQAARDAELAGAVFGVWNADRPGDPLRLDDGRLTGSKTFASGAGLLSHALVTVDAEGGRQLLLIDMNDAPPTVDRNWWRVSGMQRSETHIVRWEDREIAPERLIGGPGDYSQEPFFGGGAIRFAAVQAAVSQHWSIKFAITW